MSKPTPLYPKASLQLSGADGNAFMILGQCERVMRNANIPDAERQKFRDEATSGDYDHLLQTCMKWFKVS
jgi:hypothetical protein